MTYCVTAVKQHMHVVYIEVWSPGVLQGLELGLSTQLGTTQDTRKNRRTLVWAAATRQDIKH